MPGSCSVALTRDPIPEPHRRSSEFSPRAAERLCLVAGDHGTRPDKTEDPSAIVVVAEAASTSLPESSDRLPPPPRKEPYAKRCHNSRPHRAARPDRRRGRRLRLYPRDCPDGSSHGAARAVRTGGVVRLARADCGTPVRRELGAIAAAHPLSAESPRPGPGDRAEASRGSRAASVGRLSCDPHPGLSFAAHPLFLKSQSACLTPSRRRPANRPSP